jgi:hypothetical protein
MVRLLIIMGATSVVTGLPSSSTAMGFAGCASAEAGTNAEKRLKQIMMVTVLKNQVLFLKFFPP